MSFGFESDQNDRINQSSSDPRGGSANDSGEFEPDPYDTREANTPPRGLMRKRRHPIVWIGLALVLGGLIALFLAAMVTG
jgi:hypothetical protein